MTTSPVLSAALAVLCVLAIGASATTLESSMETDPDDVIDLDWDRLPIGEETAIELNEEIADGGEREAPDAGSESETEPRPQPDGGSQDSLGVAERMEQRMSEAQRDVSEAQQGGTTPDPDRFPWGLLWLLAAIGLSIALGAIGYRYLGRLDADPYSTDGGADQPPWPPDGPTTEVDRAWFAMVSRLDLDRPWTRTPAEFAAAAVEAGLDPEAVEQVTTAFVDVRYGGSPVTTLHRERARSGLRRLDVEREGDPA